MSQLTIDTGFNIELGFELAPIHKRMLAYIVDSIIVVAYVIAIFRFDIVKLSDFSEDDSYNLVKAIAFVLPALLYHLIFEITTGGQSPGKKILGIKVVSLDGNKASISQYFIRFFLRGIDMNATSYLCGILTMALTKNGQRLGDLAAGTTLVNTTLPYSIDDTIFKNISDEKYLVRFPDVMKLSDRDINTINSVIKHSEKTNTYSHIENISMQIRNTLGINTDLEHQAFLYVLLDDYNYLSNNR